MDNSQLMVYAPSLILSSLKRCYCEDEKVVVTVALANFTQQPLVINKRLRMIFDYKYREAYELQFQVVGPDKILIAPIEILENWRRWHLTPDDFVELSPGEQWQQEIVLSMYFDFSRSGLYQIVAKYHNDYDGHQFGLDAWTGELCSPPVEVLIDE